MALFLTGFAYALFMTLGSTYRLDREQAAKLFGSRLADRSG